MNPYRRKRVRMPEIVYEALQENLEDKNEGIWKEIVRRDEEIQKKIQEKEAEIQKQERKKTIGELFNKDTSEKDIMKKRIEDIV